MNEFRYINDGIIQEVFRKNEEGVSGIKSEYEDLDYAIGAFEKGILYVIAGRPAMGKTTFALNLVKNFIKRDCSIIYFSLQNNAYKLTERLLHVQGGISVNTFKNCCKIADVYEAAKIVESSNLLINDTSGLNVDDLFSDDVYKLLGNADVIIFDYLQLMTSDGIDEEGVLINNRREEIGYILKQLKRLAKEALVPVIILSQLSRAVEQRPDHRPLLSDLKDSGKIEEVADTVLMLYRDDYYYYDSDKKGTMEVYISKNYSGDIGMVQLNYNHETLNIRSQSN